MYDQDRQRIRARRSRYGSTPTPPPRGPRRGRVLTGRRIAALACLMLLVLGGWFTWRAVGFLRALNVSNPFAEIGNQLNPPQGSVGWKIQNGQPVNLLLLGYGGAENDAPYLTDTLMVLSIDSANHRAVMASVPRDLKVKICAYADGHCDVNKINVAYSTGMYDSSYPGKKSQFANGNGGNKDSGGNLSMQTVGQVTGLNFDGYVAVDFVAFRDLVDSLGGIQVCLDSPLDDNQYPDYHNGYVRGGIHFKVGCQQVNGEQALQLARSRHAIQPEQANDWGRIKRQQLIVNAIRKKATSINAITHIDSLMQTVAKDFSTNLSTTDARILYNWSKQVPDSAIGKVSVDVTNFLYDSGCGGGAYFECATDPSYQMLHTFFSHLLVDPSILNQKAPVQIANASYGLPTMQTQVQSALAPLGINVVDPVRVRVAQQSAVYDYSGGKYGKTAQWLASYFGAQVVTATASTPPPTPNPPQGGIVLVLGRDFSVRWVGQG
jgi:LCP family protein required for cell wall assembly